MAKISRFYKGLYGRVDPCGRSATHGSRAGAGVASVETAKNPGTRHGPPASHSGRTSVKTATYRKFAVCRGILQGVSAAPSASDSLEPILKKQWVLPLRLRRQTLPGRRPFEEPLVRERGGKQEGRGAALAGSAPGYRRPRLLRDHPRLLPPSGISVTKTLRPTPAIVAVDEPSVHDRPRFGGDGSHHTP